jgi:hypothetical protein
VGLTEAELIREAEEGMGLTHRGISGADLNCRDRKEEF